MTKPIKTIDDLFELAGGSVQVAALLGKNQWVVDRWKKTGIPHRHWKLLIQEYKPLGVDVHTLHDISQRAIDVRRAG